MISNRMAATTMMPRLDLSIDIIFFISFLVRFTISNKQADGTAANCKDKQKNE